MVVCGACGNEQDERSSAWGSLVLDGANMPDVCPVCIAAVTHALEGEALRRMKVRGTFPDHTRPPDGWMALPGEWCKPGGSKVVAWVRPNDSPTLTAKASVDLGEIGRRQISPWKYHPGPLAAVLWCEQMLSDAGVAP